MRKLSSILLFALVLLLGGCATMGSPTPAQQAANAQAEVLYQRGDFLGAARTWESLAAPGQHSPLPNRYALRAADARLLAGEDTRARTDLAQVDATRLSGVSAARYNLLQGELALPTDPQRALAIAAMLPDTLPKDLQLRTARLMANAARALGDPWTEARALARMNPLLSGAARLRNTRKIDRILVGMGVSTLQKRAMTLAANDAFLPWVGRALQRLGSALPAALPSLVSPAGTIMGSGRGAVAEGFRAYRRIALLLPLSGPLKAAGEAVAEGFFTAYFDAPAGQPRPHVLVFDTRGTSKGALEAYQQAQAAGANLIVGPLARGAVATLFANHPALPLMALNHPGDNIEPPPGCVEFGLMPQSDGIQVAARMRELGIREAVVFDAGTDNEQRAAQAFKAQFEGSGGKVLAVQSLPSDSVNFGKQIESAATGLGPDGAIFVAVAPETARLLLPQIRVARLTQPVFATTQVYAGFPNPLDRDLDGVQFPDAPWLYDAQPGLPSRASLARDLPAAGGRGARLFAFGMDAELLSPYFVWLQRHPNSYVPGATGQLSVDARSHVQRTPIWVHFVHGVATPVTGTLDAAPAPANSKS